MTPSDLPIYQIRDALLERLSRGRRLVLTAPTGSGKSTQVPQMLLDAGFLGRGQVVILQPRRLPARLLAAWVARSRGGKLGDEVGYQIRLDNVTSPATRIRYVTEGVLLRQMLSDPELAGVSAILFDEFHERHLYGDITLARAVQLQETTRPDLRLVVMSATLDAVSVEQYLQPCAMLSSAGRTYPVTVEYLAKSPGDQPVWELAAEGVERLMRQQPEGDVLVFMPGAYEIGRAVQAVRDTLGSSVLVLPLHGELAPNDQDAAVARSDRRKVVVATNVAETSLTIEGVRLVVDSGLARIPRFDPYRGINTLLVDKISQASAEQRAGRAGRTAPGHCLRLWTEREHGQRAAQELPEVRRLDLAEVVLTLKASGVEDIATFRWLEPPEPRALTRAEQLLHDLGALGADGGITETGRRMLAFPVHPRYARMLLAAQDQGCVRQVALIAALTQGRELLVRSQGRSAGQNRAELLGEESGSDFFVLMRAWRYADRQDYRVDRCRQLGIHAQAARQVGPLFEQFLQIAQREGLDVGEPTGRRPTPEAIQRCVLAGFSDQVARRLDAGTLRCELVHGRRGVLARESTVQQAPLLVAAEVREVQSGTGRDKELHVLLSLATAIKEPWLRELYPDDFSESSGLVYDAGQRRIFREHRKQFRDLLLAADREEIQRRSSGRRTREEREEDGRVLNEAAALLAAEVARGNLVLKNWDDGVEQWIARVNCLRDWMPELELPAIAPADREAILQQICYGAVSYKEIKERPVWPAVKGWLSAAQQAAVERCAPERLELPGGRKAKVTYSTEVPPLLAARIQDLYGLKRGLTIADGRVSVVIQVLAPNNRPIQVTQDLAKFWKETYPVLKQQLQRRYPKHEWR